MLQFPELYKPAGMFPGGKKLCQDWRIPPSKLISTIAPSAGTTMFSWVRQWVEKWAKMNLVDIKFWGPARRSTILLKISWVYYRAHDMFSRILRIWKLISYWSIKKGIWNIHIWEKSKQIRIIYIIFCRKIRRFVFGKFVKTCRELDPQFFDFFLLFFFFNVVKPSAFSGQRLGRVGFPMIWHCFFCFTFWNNT